MAKKTYTKPTANMCKYVEGFENYIIFDDGRLFSLNIMDFIKPSHDRQGHLQVGLYKGNKQKTTSIHRLVAKAFIPNPNNLDCVHHIDWNKENNNVENLMWISNSEHKSLHMTGNTYNNKRVMNIDTGEVYESAKCASLALGCSEHNVSINIMRGYRTHGYNFKYLED